MATLNEVIEGLQIFLKSGGEASNICAEHDIIYASSDADLSKEDEKALEELGWFVDKESGSWARFV